MATTPFMVDIETDGPSQRRHSMVWFAAVLAEESLNTVFEGRLAPISNEYEPEALAVSRLTREETLQFPSPLIVMPAFVAWVHANTMPGSRPELWSDNNGYDMGFLNFYLWEFAGENPFGHTSRNLNDRYRGMIEGLRSAGVAVPKAARRSFEHLITIPHDHNPVNDARGNAQALLGMQPYGQSLAG